MPHKKPTATGKIRIAVVQQSIPPYRVPVFRKLSENPANQAVFICGQNRDQDGRLTTEGTLPFATTVVRNLRGKVFGYNIRYQMGVLRVVRRNNSQVIIAEGTFGIISNWILALYARMTGKKFILWVCGWERQVLSGRKWIKYQAVRPFLNLCDAYIAYGTVAKNYLMKLGANPEAIFIAQNSIDTDKIFLNRKRFEKDALKLRRELGIGKDAVILYVGALNSQKKVDILLRAFGAYQANHEHSHLIIIGDGPELSNLQSISNRLSLRNAYFLGKVVDNVYKYFATCDVFVLPGLGGLAINQAMCFGKSVVCGIGDGTEQDLIIDGKTGIFVDPMNEENLTRAIENLMSDAKKRRLLGNNALKRIRDIATIDKMVSGMQNAIEYSLAKKQ